MLSLWQRLPVIVRAVVAGAAVSTAGVYPWVFFVKANQRVLLGVPWARQLTSKAPPLIWDTGADAAFWGYFTAFILLGSAAVWAYVTLASVARSERGLVPSLAP